MQDSIIIDDDISIDFLSESSASDPTIIPIELDTDVIEDSSVSKVEVNNLNIENPIYQDRDYMLPGLKLTEIEQTEVQKSSALEMNSVIELVRYLDGSPKLNTVTGDHVIENGVRLDSNKTKLEELRSRAIELDKLKSLSDSYIDALNCIEKVDTTPHEVMQLHMVEDGLVSKPYYESIITSQLNLIKYLRTENRNDIANDLNNLVTELDALYLDNKLTNNVLHEYLGKFQSIHNRFDSIKSTSTYEVTYNNTLTFNQLRNRRVMVEINSTDNETLKMYYRKLLNLSMESMMSYIGIATPIRSKDLIDRCIQKIKDKTSEQK